MESCSPSRLVWRMAGGEEIGDGRDGLRTREERVRYRKKPVVIEAELWFKNGDHSEDGGPEVGPCPDWFNTEGEVVRRYRRPEGDGRNRCGKCDKIMRDHGWIDTLKGGHIVCPGDWIITGIKGERYPCKPDIFEATYEKVEE